MGVGALNAARGVYSFFNSAGQWATLNQAYLNGQMFLNQQPFLSNVPLGQEGSGFAMEPDHLSNNGFGPSQWQYVPLPLMWY